MVPKRPRVDRFSGRSGSGHKFDFMTIVWGRGGGGFHWRAINPEAPLMTPPCPAHTPRRQLVTLRGKGSLGRFWVKQLPDPPLTPAESRAPQPFLVDSLPLEFGRHPGNLSRDPYVWAPFCPLSFCPPHPTPPVDVVVVVGCLIQL